MRVAGPDVVLFVAGLLLFSGSVYGLTKTEGGIGGGATSAFGAFTIDWTSRTEDESLASFGSEPSATFELVLNESGATQIVFSVACAHAQAVPGVTTAIHAKITQPNGNVTEADGACGSPLEIPITLAPDPKGSAVEAANAEEATRVAEGTIGAAGVGTYSGELTFTQSSSAPVPLPVQVDWSGDVTATITKWTAAASPVTR